MAYYFCKSISSNAKEIRAACPSSGKVMNGNDRGGRPFSLPSEASGPYFFWPLFMKGPALLGWPSKPLSIPFYEKRIRFNLLIGWGG